MEECPNTKDVVVMGVNNQTREALFFNPRCKMWSCDYCAEQNKDYWVFQAQRGAMLLLEQNQTLQFITVTPRGYFTPNSSIYFFRKNWPKLRKRAATLTKGWEPFTGVSWSYFLVPERHKSGRLHAHLIAATHLDGERWWKDNAYSCGMGHQVKVKSIENSAEAAGYVTKYLTKDAGGIEWPKGFMRVRHSQNWPIRETLSILPGWEWQTISDDAYWIESRSLIDMGYDVKDRVNQGKDGQ